MNNYLMVEKLKKAGIRFDKGLTHAEISKIESQFGFHFPKEIASFLSCAYPIGGSFFDYRNTSQENINKFFDFQNNIEESFVFDIEHNTSSLQAMLAEHLGEFTDTESFKKAVLESLQNSPRLIPFYAHRCFFNGLDGMPIVSFWQAVDTIIYGYDFEDYLEAEFLTSTENIASEEITDGIFEKLKSTGIWYYIIE